MATTSATTTAAATGATGAGGPVLMMDDEDVYYERLYAQADWTEAEEDDDPQQQPSSQATLLSLLLTLVQSYDWAGTLARIASAPYEARAIGYQGRTPLHVACDHDAPAVVVQSLLRAYPEASTKVGTTLMNPLHITCSSQHASVHVVRVLLDGGDPIQTSMRDVDGDTPLHTACRCGAPMEVLEVLLRANPTVVHDRDFEGLTPLLRLWVRYFVILGDDVIDSVRGATDVAVGELGDAWKKTELLLQCAHHGSLPPLWMNYTNSSTSHTASNSSSSNSAANNNNTIGGGAGDESTTERGVFRVLHAAAAVDCPRAVVKIATILHAQQLEERDEQGMTPLLLACKAPIYKVRDLSDKGYLLEDRIHDGDVMMNIAASYGAGTTSTTTTTSTNAAGHEDTAAATSASTSTTGIMNQPSVIDILLQAPLHPERQLLSSSVACIPSPCGRLPLNWAILSGKKWKEGIEALVECYPDALSMIDMETNLYPFMLAATVASATTTSHHHCNDVKSEECCSTSTIYELLRLDPSLASVQVKE